MSRFAWLAYALLAGVVGLLVFASSNRASDLDALRMRMAILETRPVSAWVLWGHVPSWQAAGGPLHMAGYLTVSAHESSEACARYQKYIEETRAGYDRMLCLPETVRPQ